MGEVALIVASAGLKLGAAKMEKDRYEMQAQEARENANLSRLSAKGQAADRERQRRMQISSIRADAASRGVSASPGGTIGSLIRRENTFAKIDSNRIMLMGESKARQYGLSAKASKQAGKGALISGVSSAFGQGAEYKMAKDSGKQNKA